MKPGACRTSPPDFDHLTLAEVWRHERLIYMSREGALTPTERDELAALHLRKYPRPRVNKRRSGAA